MLLIAAPALGIPMALSAAGIVWASVYGSSHYITDVIVGAAIGMIFGTLGGLTLRYFPKK
jgi:membrane-associated phospholipid phosphatase